MARRQIKKKTPKRTKRPVNCIIPARLRLPQFQNTLNINRQAPRKQDEVNGGPAGTRWRRLGAAFVFRCPFLPSEGHEGLPPHTRGLFSVTNKLASQNISVFHLSLASSCRNSRAFPRWKQFKRGSSNWSHVRRFPTKTDPYVLGQIPAGDSGSLSSEETWLLSLLTVLVNSN